VHRWRLWSLSPMSTEHSISPMCSYDWHAGKTKALVNKYIIWGCFFTSFWDSK
jgi:hypothetical protein